MQISLRGIYDETIIPDEWLLERLRIQRDKLLVESDWTQVADAPINQSAWATYRQQLRDLPSSWTPSEIVDLPLSPKEQ